MSMKTMDEYRTRISKQPKRPSNYHITEMKYFEAGFEGAAMAAREGNKKIKKPNRNDSK